MIGLFTLSLLLIIPIIIIPFVIAIRRNISYWKQQNGVSIGRTEVVLEDVLDTPVQENQIRPVSKLKSWEFPELWFMGIAPLVGMGLVGAFHREIKPFALEYVSSLFLFIMIPYLSYWISRYGKERLSILMNIALSYGMLIGLGLYLALFLHFIAPITILAGAIFSFLAFPLFAPLPALLYNVREIQEQQYHLQIQIQSNYSWYARLQLSWRNLVINLIVVIIIIVGLIFLLSLFGQDIFSIIDVFLEGKGFLFSTTRGAIF